MGPAPPYIPCVLERIGYDAGMARWVAAADLALGRVARVERGLVGALTEAGPVRTSIGAELLASMARDPVNGPCAGDWAVLRSWPDDRCTVERILPRRTALCCPAAGAAPHQHALCANIDLAALVLPAGSTPGKRTERLRALAGTSGARVVVVVGDSDGVGRLRGFVAGHRTVALLGPSGRDTSALVDALVGAPVLTFRAGGQGGQPVRRALVTLPGGGAVIDMGSARCAQCSHDVPRLRSHPWQWQG